MMGSSVQSREPGPCRSQTANMWTDVQFSTRPKSITCTYTFNLLPEWARNVVLISYCCEFSVAET